MFTFPFSELSNDELDVVFLNDVVENEVYENYDEVDNEVYYNGHWYPTGPSNDEVYTGHWYPTA
jgi:hypothetical protein